MRPANKSNRRSSTETTRGETLPPATQDSRPSVHSGFVARQSPDSVVADLAARLASELSRNEAIDTTITALSNLVPGCRVCVQRSSVMPGERFAVDVAHRGSDAATSPSDVETAHTPDRCEWQLVYGMNGLSLIVELQQVRSPRDVARVLDLGERVAGLLVAALRRETLKSQLVAQSQEILELRQRLIQAEKLSSYGQLVASILHDLNNPLTAILAYTEYLNRSLGTSATSASDLERLARIREAADTVLRHTRSLVDYARPPRSPCSSIDVSVLIGRALVLCEHEFDRVGLRASSNLANFLPEIVGHPEQLTQLFVNLFTNAAQAARGDRAELSIEAMAPTDSKYLTVQVRDNGVGIRAEDIEHVFEPFYSTKGGSGCGLGLSIVRDIVEQHGGRVDVASDPLGGTTFAVSLPLARSLGTGATNQKSPHQVGRQLAAAEDREAGLILGIGPQEREEGRGDEATSRSGAISPAGPVANGTRSAPQDPSERTIEHVDRDGSARESAVVALREKGDS